MNHVVWRDEIGRQLEQRGIDGVTRRTRKRKLPKGRKIASTTLRQISRDEAREWLRKRQLPLF